MDIEVVVPRLNPTVSVGEPPFETSVPLMVAVVVPTAVAGLVITVGTVIVVVHAVVVKVRSAP